MTVNRIPIRKRYTLMLNQIQIPKPSSDLGLLPLWEVQGAGFAWDQLSLGWFWETLARKEETQINLLLGDCQPACLGCGSFASHKSQDTAWEDQSQLRLKSST